MCAQDTNGDISCEWLGRWLYQSSCNISSKGERNKHYVVKPGILPRLASHLTVQLSQHSVKAGTSVGSELLGKYLIAEVPYDDRESQDLVRTQCPLRGEQVPPPCAYSPSPAQPPSQTSSISLGRETPPRPVVPTLRHLGPRPLVCQTLEGNPLPADSDSRRWLRTVVKILKRTRALL